MILAAAEGAAPAGDLDALEEALYALEFDVLAATGTSATGLEASLERLDSEIEGFWLDDGMPADRPEG
jgi:hypothetical protein